jgi:hypothetical protein
VGNSPTNAIDPFGLDTQKPSDQRPVSDKCKLDVDTILRDVFGPFVVPPSSSSSPVIIVIPIPSPADPVEWQTIPKLPPPQGSGLPSLPKFQLDYPLGPSYDLIFSPGKSGQRITLRCIDRYGAEVDISVGVTHPSLDKATLKAIEGKGQKFIVVPILEIKRSPPATK